MKLKDLKNKMILAKEEIELNKTLVIRGVKVHFMSIIRENNKNTIWAVYENKRNINDREMDMHELAERTNRDNLYDSIANQSGRVSIHIKNFTIQGQEFKVSSSSSSSVEFNNMESIMRLQHFSEAKLLPTFLDETNINDICMASFTQMEDGKLPVIDRSKEISMTAFVGSDHKSFLLNTPLSIGFDKNYAGSYTFYNPLRSTDSVYYLQPLELYDIWEEMRLKFEGEPFKGFTREQMNQMSENMYKGIEGICPKGMKLAVLKYETDDDISLDFRSKEYLDTKIIMNNTASAFAFLCSPDEKIGPNGLKNKVCHIKAVDENDTRDIDIELFSFAVTIPEISVDSDMEDKLI